jgi:hypothetical protein
MTSTISSNDKSKSSSKSTWNKDSFYHPKIHYVTEGVKSVQGAKQYEWQFNAFLKHYGLQDGRDEDLRLLLQKDPVNIEELIVEYLTSYLNRETPKN